MGKYISKLTVALSLLMVSLMTGAIVLFGGLANATSLTITGHVQSSTGSSLYLAYVYVTQPSSDAVQYGPVATNSSGNYTLSVGAPGTYDIHFQPPANSGYSEVVNSSVSITSNQTINASLSSGTSVLSGTLTDNSSNPLSGVTVKIINGGSTYQSTTNASGVYSISAPAAKYYLSMTGSISGISTFTLNQSYSSSINLTGGDMSLNLVLQTATVTVTAYNNAGQPAWGSNESVYARATSGVTRLYPGDPGTNISVVFSDGFSTSGSATGTIKTIVGALYAGSGLESSSYTTSICKKISGKTGVYDCLVKPTVISGDVSLGVPQENSAVREFSGVLTDSSSNPIPGATITLIKYGDTSTHAQTDANGEFSISVEPKKYYLMVDKQTEYAYMSNFTLTQSSTNPSIDLMNSDVVQDLQVDNTFLTVTAYDRYGNLNYFTTVNARATNGTVYLYSGDPGESVVINSVPFTTTSNATGTMGTIVGASYTALGLDSTQWVGSICETIPGSKFDCITTPLTVTGATNIAVPHS